MTPQQPRSTVSAAGEPTLSFGEIRAAIGEWWNDYARDDHAVGINLADPHYRRDAFDELARLIHSKAEAAESRPSVTERDPDAIRSRAEEIAAEFYEDQDVNDLGIAVAHIALALAQAEAGIPLDAAASPAGPDPSLSDLSLSPVRQPEPLDVERLAEAIHRDRDGDDDLCFTGGQKARPEPRPWHSCDEDAKRVAAEYARLGASGAPGEPRA